MSEYKSYYNKDTMLYAGALRVGLLEQHQQNVENEGNVFVDQMPPFSEDSIGKNYKWDIKKKQWIEVDDLQYIKNQKIKEIAELKDKLSKDDYKIIKSYEYSLAGQEIPYDLETLIYERDVIRDKINELEKEIE